MTPTHSLASFGVTIIMIVTKQGYDTFVLSLTPENIQQIQPFESHLQDDNLAHQ
jgi:hypothetical protein